MKIAVIGTGYVGLVAGACFADSGNTVVCVDIDEEKINRLREGILPIYEPGLESVIERTLKDKRLVFTTSHLEAIQNSEIIFLAVGTPTLPNGDSDLSYVMQAAEQIGKSLNGYKVIVNKSTVPIGSHLRVREWISSHTQTEFDVVSNPEFLREGSAVEDFQHPDRVIIGTQSQRAFEMMEQLYTPFCQNGSPILRMDPVSAEITKYACNAFLATRISFINEISRLCERVGGDVEWVRKGMITDERIGKHFLNPGIGYGGSCFPKDVKALLKTAETLDIELKVVAAAENANEVQKGVLAKKVLEEFGDDLRGKTFALWGLAFKPNTDDVREAPALVIAQKLLQSGARILGYDPVAQENFAKVLKFQVSTSEIKNYQPVQHALDATKGADALLLATEWNEFRQPNLEALKKNLKSPIIFDGRNAFDAELLRENGFKVLQIGRS